MKRITLLHLTFTGNNKEPASIDFGPSVTVIHGPSDTGKSFIVDAIDFVLGAGELKEIPERKGYTRVLLGMELPNGERITLARPVDGGNNVYLYQSCIRDESSATPDQKLAARHDPKKMDNISRFLLSQIGLDGKKVRKSKHNVTNTLSFRDLIRLCLIDEIKIQSKYKPGFSGQSTNKTKEASVLKLVLTGEDDSALIAVPTPQQKKLLREAQQEIVKRMLLEIEPQLQDVDEPKNLSEQLDRLNAEIDERNAKLEPLLKARNELLTVYKQRQTEKDSCSVEESEAETLRGRFTILEKQYESDLARLEMIKETGNLLGYFQQGICVFCGAEPSKQHLEPECGGAGNLLSNSVEAETQKTLGLLDDLRVTIEHLDARIIELQGVIDTSRQEIESIEQQINIIDAKMNLGTQSLQELLAKRSEVEKYLGFYEQVKTYKNMLQQITDEAASKTTPEVTGLNQSVEEDFSKQLAERLVAWGYPSAESVRYDSQKYDIVAGEHPRSAHGKGVRAILHAAFTITLAQYCFKRGMPFPGFVVLDSPLVTYRSPDSGEDDELPGELGEAFYRDIQTNFDGQIIVIENTDSLELIGAETKEICFTKQINEGRYGFLPAVENEVVK